MNIKFWYFTLLREIGRIISKKITFSNRYHRILHILLLSRCICIYKNRRGNLALQLSKNVQYNTIISKNDRMVSQILVYVFPVTSFYAMWCSIFQDSFIFMTCRNIFLIFQFFRESARCQQQFYNV